MLGFLKRLFIGPEGLWLNYCFDYSKSLFSASMHRTPYISITTHTSTTGKPVLLQQCLESQVFLAKY